MKDLKFNLDDNNQFVVRAIGLLKNDNKVLVQGRKGKKRVWLSRRISFIFRSF